MGFVEALQRGGMLFLFVFLVLAVLYGLILLFSAILRLAQGKKKDEPAQEAAATTPVVAAMEPTGVWGGQLRLQDVDEQTAAIVMAIVSDESGIPLSELVFKSIRLVKSGQE